MKSSHRQLFFVRLSAAAALGGMLVSCQATTGSGAPPAEGPKVLYSARANVPHVDPPSPALVSPVKPRARKKAPEDTLLGKALYPVANGLIWTGRAAIAPAMVAGYVLSQSE